MADALGLGKLGDVSLMKQIEMLRGRPKFPTTFEMPQMPKYVGPAMPGTAELGTAMGAMRKRAYGEEMSPWAKLAMQAQAEQMGTRRSDLSAQLAGMGAQARGEMAMRGGLSQGARERMASEGLRTGMREKAKLAGTGLQEQLGILGEAEKERETLFRGLPGAEIQALQPEFEKTKMAAEAEKFNLKNQLELAMKKYEEEAKMYGAEKEAEAIEKAGCWLISELSKHVCLPAEEPDLITKYKLYAMGRDMNGSKFYIRRCKKLIQNMNNAGFDWLTMIGWNDSMLRLIKANQFESAYILFLATLVDLIGEYWPDCPFVEYKRLCNDLKILQNLNVKVEPPKMNPLEKEMSRHCSERLIPKRFKAIDMFNGGFERKAG